MANPANRLFKLMQNSGTDTITELVSLYVKSTSPLQLSNGDKLILTEDFLVFSKFIDTDKINIDDKFLAIVLNQGQIYYITDVISSTNELNKYNSEITTLKDRLSSVEDSIITLSGQIDSLDDRVTTLENRY